MGGVTNRTDAEDVRLRALLAEGLSYALIAAQLAMEGFPPRTRCAVLGRANRLGLRQRPESLVDHAAARGATKRRPRVRLSTAKPKGDTAHKIVVAPLPEPVPPPAPDRPGVPVAGDTRGLCQWPLWPDQGVTAYADKRVCGERAFEGESWCPACRQIAYRPREVRHREDRRNEPTLARWNYA